MKTLGIVLLAGFVTGAAHADGAASAQLEISGSLVPPSCDIQAFSNIELNIAASDLKADEETVVYETDQHRITVSCHEASRFGLHVGGQKGETWNPSLGRDPEGTEIGHWRMQFSSPDEGMSLTVSQNTGLSWTKLSTETVKTSVAGQRFGITSKDAASTFPAYLQQAEFRVKSTIMIAKSSSLEIKDGLEFDANVALTLHYI